MPCAARKPSVPELRYADALPIDQLSSQWGRTTFFVRRLITDDELAVDDRRLITNAALHDFFRLHGTELD